MYFFSALQLKVIAYTEISCGQHTKMPPFGTNHLERDQTVYEKLLYDDASSIEEQEQQPAGFTQIYPRRYSRYCTVGIACLLIDILFIASFCLVFWRYQSMTSAARSIDWISCGNSSAEARAAGCHYEPMQRSWIPHACYFKEPSEEYDPFSDRKWFFDTNLTHQITGKDLNRLREGDDLTAYTRFFHNEHCVYCWRKLAIAIEKRLPMIDSKTANFHHSTHCAAMLMQELYEVGVGKFDTHFETHSPLMFQTCVPLGWK